MAVPAVPSPFPEPGTHIWEASDTIFRVFDHGYGSAQYNATGVSRRFRPVLDAGTIVPTVYGSSAEDGAICETVFHDVDFTAPSGSILHADLLTQLLAPIVPTRDLRLAALTDPHIERLEVAHGDIIETRADEYPATAQWGQAIYEHPAEFDGIVWDSRQHHATLTVMLWEPRAGVLRSASTAPAEPLFVGRGYYRVLELANAMDVAVIP